MDYLPKVPRKRHPYQSANFLSKLSFLYTLDLFMKGCGESLESRDLYEVPSSLKSEKLGGGFEELWRQQQNKRSASIHQLLLRNYGLYYAVLGFSQLVVKTALIILIPLIVEEFASFFKPSQTNVTKSYTSLCGLSIIVLVLLESLYQQWYSFKLTTLEIEIRTSLIALLYRKILRVSSFCTNGYSTGKVITLITKDVFNLELCIRHANDVWISSIQAIIFLYLLFKKMGFVAFAVLILFGVLVPFQIRLAKKSMSITEEMLKRTDSRLQTTADILTKIRIIKMYTWEKFFQEKLSKIRKEEMDETYKIFLLKFLIYTNGVIWTCSSFFLQVVLYVNVGVNKMVNLKSLLLVFELYRRMGYTLTITLPLSISQIARTATSIQRINNFLSLEEISKSWQKCKKSAVLFKNVSVLHRKETVLKDINLDFKNNLTVITGASGSGKSFLLKTILEEGKVVKGEITIKGTVAYFSQKPWIFPSTIRQNILFGEEFNEKLYNHVLSICGLVGVLQKFQYGDQTITGINGAALSKSEIIRINLARAVYKKSDIYLLDDPFSELDSYLGQHVFKNVVNFLEKKTVVLVSQNAKILTRAQKCVILERGEFADSLTNEIKPHSKCFDYKRFLLNNEIEDAVENASETTTLLSDFENKNIYEEKKKNGEVEYSVYRKWISAGGDVGYLILIILLSVLSSVVMKFIEKSIDLWSINEEQILNYTRSSFFKKEIIGEMFITGRNIISTQILLLLVLLISTFGFCLFMMDFSKRVSVKLHKFLTESLFNFNFHFFGNTTGNVLNRFSKDFLNIDEIVPFMYLDLFKALLPMVLTIILIVFTQKLLLVPLSILFLTIKFLRKVYLTVGRNLKRLETSTRSPVVAFFDATIEGLTTIKTKNSQNKDILKREFNSHLDLHTSASFTYLCATKALCLYVGWTLSIFVGIVVSQFLIIKTDSSTVSLLMFQTILFVEILNKAFLNWTETETYMTSVERVLFTNNIQKRQTVEEWPKLGEIKFEDICLWYDGMTRPVLKNNNFEILPKQKIGIVGQSSAGKTSIISVLLRMVDFEGKVFINGVNTKTMSLKTLRSNISVVTQDFPIFNGSIRENLDPGKKYSDDEIWEKLEIVDLKKIVWDLNADIYSTYVACSLRNKQLLYLAKVILEKNDVIVFDDFLCNIDEDTERLVCDIIEKVFIDSTMLIITHNLGMLSCCDKVVYLEDGRIKYCK